MRTLLILVGITLAAAGGAIAYRAVFLEPRAGIIISETGVREYPDVARTVGGLLLLGAGAAVAFFAALRRR